MRTLTCLCLMLMLGAGALAVENQAFLGIFAETRVMKIVGMPDMPDMPSIPGMKSNFDMPGKPSRSLTVRLWSPGIAPAKSFASLAIPPGLKLGKKLDLDLYRPKPETGEAGEAGGPDDPGQIPNFTIKRYWGSSTTVKPGQPEIITFDKLTPAQQAQMRAEARKAQRRDTYFYKPDWTTGYWPTSKQPGAIDKTAGLPGSYALTTNYTGNVSIDVPDTVDFLEPITFSAPDFSKKIPFESAMTFKWSAIPNILGYHATIIGMQGKNTMIIWDSSEVRDGFGTNWDYLEMAEVRKLVKSTVLMGAERASVSVPAGIFKECDMVMMTMIGYGTGTALDQAQPLPRVQTKTTLMGMLGGKKMDGMGMGMPMGE